ncbi:proton-coupled amino acid transporter-like protein CG1139, partial [Lucilia sericata]|uniref:proton-coupled amino acid transporter-like protein CG1139 n=1 Tax=Lucilia sericata TaxID=13632 RepID=UPI0018A8355C
MSFHKSDSRTPLAPTEYTIHTFGYGGCTAQQAAGSTLPLVISRKKGGSADDSEDVNYNPFEHRKVEHPTSDTETLIHLLKGSLGSGILAMPMAFLNSGLWFGLVATFLS